MARIAAVAPDLFFASKIDATLRAAGHDVELVQAPAAVLRRVFDEACGVAEAACEQSLCHFSSFFHDSTAFHRTRLKNALFFSDRILAR